MKSRLSAGQGSSFLAFALLSAFLTGMMSLGSAQVRAQEGSERTAEGYITAIHPAGFDVNGQHVMALPTTTYGIFGAKAPAERPSGDGFSTPNSSRDSLHVGAFVRVSGIPGKGTKSIQASFVLFRNDWDKKLAGFGVVERIVADEPHPTFAADGYRIRIASSTEVSFGGNLKTLADVIPNTWVYYKGRRDAEGVLIASRAKFVPARGREPKWLAPGSKTPPVQTPVPQGGALLDANGNMQNPHAKVRLGDAGGYCGWHRVPANEALQQRILAIGQKLLPAYQEQLAMQDPSRIPFRFYAVEENKVRSDLFCNAGLILIPTQVVERLQNDDQIAALLADGIAFNIQVQSAQLIAQNRELLGAEIAIDAAVPVPAVALGVDLGALLVGYQMDAKMEEQRGRMALALMAEAGYDPRQAPEAWRRLAPKHLPTDADSLKYPNRSGYQLGILNVQYAAMPAIPNSQAASTGSR